MSTVYRLRWLGPLMAFDDREHEMAALAVYLASPASEYTRGQEIFIDGGLLSVNP